ncbi:MAG: hypothetical protein KDB26_02240 [Microthrixaceae bacterium]|nr:hypothetical protein [Microthrixaceae bacterium]
MTDPDPATESNLGLSGPFIIDEFRLSGSTVELDYAFGDPESPTYRFTEVVEFESPLGDTPQVRCALRILHLLAGTSYYKSIAPCPIVVDSLNAVERALMQGMYDGGLREFAYRNGLTVPLPVDLAERDSEAGSVTDASEPDESNGVVGSDRVLIPVGGGKDSALVADLIPDGTLLSVNPTGAHEHLAESLGRSLIKVKRTLDPQLRDLVARGALNGHVPVTAINSAISVAVAASAGFGYVAMGLERSASEPTLISDGVEVNHQYSKSAAGEALLRDALSPTGVTYFSLLRPLTELAIGVSVAERGLVGDIVSCNRVFTIWSENEASRTQRPCGDCAKCLFTSLMLAPALTPAEIRDHFGRDLLDEEAHIEPVRELWSAAKPFDCVGERHETAAALVLLAESPAWAQQIVPKTLVDEARVVLAEQADDPITYLNVDSVESVPERFRPLIEELAETLGEWPTVRTHGSD